MEQGEKRQERQAVQMTFEQYDALVEIFKEMTAPTYYPNVRQIDKMAENPTKWILYACYLLEHGKKTRNKEEEYGKKNLRTFVNTYLELVESEDEIKHRPSLEEMRGVIN